MLDGDPALATERGTAAPTFRAISTVAKRSPISATTQFLFALDMPNIRHSHTILTSIGSTDLESVSLFSLKCLKFSPSLNLMRRHPLPGYSVLVVDTLRALVTLTFDLGQWSPMASHMVNPSTKFEDPMLFVLKLPLTMRLQTLRMRRITCPVRRGKFLQQLKSLIPICLFTMQLLWRYNDV